jgi:signal transduction histidine kinase
MMPRPQGRVELASAGLWVSTAVLGLAGAVLTVVAWQDLAVSDSYPNLASAFAAVLYASLGATIVLRVRNRMGWILLGVGLLLALLNLTSDYAILGVKTYPGTLPVPRLVGAVSEWIFIPISMGVAYLLLLFPTGTLPSPRWRPFTVAPAVVVPLMLAAYVVSPRMVALPAPGGVSLLFPNPLAIRSLNSVVAGFGSLWAVVVLYVGLLAMAVVAAVVRFRSGGQELRLQIKWVAFAAVAGVLFQVVGALAQVRCDCQSSPVGVTALLAEAAVALIGVPVAITIAILKHRLFDIDVIINRTVVYGLLASAVTAVYLTLVVGIGTLAGYGVGNPLLTTVAAVAIALLFQPLRRQAQRAANRLVYGDRATPYQVLSDFAGSLAGTVGVDDILGRMASVLADGTGASRVDVWIRMGPRLRPAATWPRDAAAPAPVHIGASDDLPALPGATRTVPVRHGDELLGALTLEKPRTEPLTAPEDSLLQHLASQAGLVLRNVRLTAELRGTIEELQASRRRLVQAEDIERRKIERNLHDGAQQQLVALKVHLGLLEAVADDAEQVKALTSRLRDAAQEALDDLRDLARGIYPPLLAERGLIDALQGQARRLTTRTTVEHEGLGRYAREVEAAVYFCVLEALQNVSKYAAATATTIRLSESAGSLVFEVEDDGVGFEPDEARYGTGVQGMTDRLDALGGSLQLTSEPGRGTVVRGAVPVASATAQSAPAEVRAPTPPVAVPHAGA